MSKERTHGIDRLIAAIDQAAGVFLALVAALTFLVAVLRYVFSTTLPDWFNLACMMQGIAIFWGIASTTYDGRHICVDGLWEMAGPRARRAIDAFADVVTFGALGTLGWMLVLKVMATGASNELSADLGVPLWPFQALAAAGILASVLLAAVRAIRTLRPA